jgi:ATP-dependent Clp protease ATP-binding subunit ClpX
MGFRASPESKTGRQSLVRHLLPEDLLRYGFIPELVGRLPILATLDPLDEEALVRILWEPRNAILKQYSKLFDMDGVELVVEPAAMDEIAREGLRRKTGARALRAIVEELILDVMFEAPSSPHLRRVVLPKGILEAGKLPVLLTEDELRQAS